MGKLASDTLGLPFVELNREIERETGRLLAEVMAFYGEEGYRRLEAEAAAQVVETCNRLVLAVGGGLVARDDTYQQVLERFHTIWLQTSPKEHMQRVRAQGDLRPMRDHPAAMEQLQSLLASRTPLYKRAEASVDTSKRTVKRSLKDLVQVIAAKGFLDGAAE